MKDASQQKLRTVHVLVKYFVIPAILAIRSMSNPPPPIITMGTTNLCPFDTLSMLEPKSLVYEKPIYKYYNITHFLSQICYLICLLSLSLPSNRRTPTYMIAIYIPKITC